MRPSLLSNVRAFELGTIVENLRKRHTVNFNVLPLVLPFFLFLSGRLDMGSNWMVRLKDCGNSFLVLLLRAFLVLQLY